MRGLVRKHVLTSILFLLLSTSLATAAFLLQSEIRFTIQSGVQVSNIEMGTLTQGTQGSLTAHAFSTNAFAGRLTVQLNASQLVDYQARFSTFTMRYLAPNGTATQPISLASTTLSFSVLANQDYSANIDYAVKTDAPEGPFAVKVTLSG